MKAAELEVGKVYFSSTSRDWQYTGWGVRKVRVLNVEHAYWTTRRNSNGKKWEQSSAGFGAVRGIVVESLHTDTGVVLETTVVPLSSIKGLWDVVNPVVESNRATRWQAAQAHQAMLDVGSKAVEENYQRAKVLGIKGVGTRGVENTVSSETLAMLLDVYAKAA